MNFSFGDQLSELGGNYVPDDYEDYSSPVYDYEGYSDIGGPLALPYKDKLAKKDEEMIGKFLDYIFFSELSFFSLIRSWFLGCYG